MKEREEPFGDCGEELFREREQQIRKPWAAGLDAAWPGASSSRLAGLRREECSKEPTHAFSSSRPAGFRGCGEPFRTSFSSCDNPRHARNPMSVCVSLVCPFSLTPSQWPLMFMTRGRSSSYLQMKWTFLSHGTQLSIVPLSFCS